MSISLIRCLAAAFVLTVGFGLCLAALAIGHADDAPGVGVIGLGLFLLGAFAAFGILVRSGQS